MTPIPIVAPATSADVRRGAAADPISAKSNNSAMTMMHLPFSSFFMLYAYRVEEATIGAICGICDQPRPQNREKSNCECLGSRYCFHVITTARAAIEPISATV